MSIINQTLRALDARRPERAAPQAPRCTAAVAKPRRTGLWVVAAGLLPMAGLAIWFIARPAAKDLPQPPAVIAQSAAPSQAAMPAPRTQPVPPPVVSAARVAAVAVPVVAEKRPAAADSSAEAEPQVPAVPARLSGSPAAMRSPAPAVVQPPVIRKEINLPTDREKADERYRKALTLIRASRQDQARPLLEEALELSPGHVAAREALATLLSNAGQNQEAEQILRTGCAMSPEHVWFAFSLARLQAARGDTEGAVASLQDGMAGRVVNAEYHATLAALLVRLKQYPDAARQYEQALKQQSGQGTWWMGLGLSLEAQGKNDDARSAYRRALMSGNLPDKLGEFVRTKLVD